MNLSRHDIPLSEAIARILHRKRLIGILFAVGVALGSLIAFTARPIFVSEVLMLPQSPDSQNGGGGISKKLSGIASAAGFALGGGGDSDERDAAVNTLSTYKTFSGFLAAENIQKKVLEESGKWNPIAFFNRSAHPTMWEAVHEFKDHVDITPAKDSSLLKLSVEWYDPISASDWANHLVAFADSELRAKALDTARARINYLQKELENNPIVPVREAISEMMENELRTMVTASADKEFTFRVIDPAIPAEKRTRPHRILIMAALGFCGMFLGSIIAVISDRPART
jgi:hypothetical protein